MENKDIFYWPHKQNQKILKAQAEELDKNSNELIQTVLTTDKYAASIHKIGLYTKFPDITGETQKKLKTLANNWNQRVDGETVKNWLIQSMTELQSFYTTYNNYYPQLSGAIKDTTNLNIKKDNIIEFIGKILERETRASEKLQETKEKFGNFGNDILSANDEIGKTNHNIEKKITKDKTLIQEHTREISKLEDEIKELDKKIGGSGFGVALGSLLLIVGIAVAIAVAVAPLAPLLIFGAAVGIAVGGGSMLIGTGIHLGTNAQERRKKIKEKQNLQTQVGNLNSDIAYLQGLSAEFESLKTEGNDIVQRFQNVDSVFTKLIRGLSILKEKAEQLTKSTNTQNFNYITAELDDLNSALTNLKDHSKNYLNAFTLKVVKADIDLVKQLQNNSSQFASSIYNGYMSRKKDSMLYTF